MLPHQLAPYYHYTVTSMIWSVMLVGEACAENTPQENVLNQLPPDCNITLWLIRTWTSALRLALTHAHSTMGDFYDLTDIRTDLKQKDIEVVQNYWVLFFGPKFTSRSSIPKDIDALLFRYCEKTCRYLMGTPSQERG